MVQSEETHFAQESLSYPQEIWDLCMAMGLEDGKGEKRSPQNDG